MSTVRDEITGQTLANEIMLERATHSRSFFLVEGCSDASLFKRFSDSDHCSIVVCAGWENLVQAISILSEMGYEDVLGFCDRDYCDKNGYPDYSGVIIFTDENDLETQIICSSALEKVLEEFGVADRIVAEVEREGISPSELVLRWSHATGALRFLSEKNGWNLKFDGMKYKFLDKNNPEFCVDLTTQHVVGRSSPVGLPDLATIKTSVRSCIRTMSNPELAKGHDCIAVFGRAFRRRFGGTNKFNSPDGRDDLAKILRIAYEFAFFQETRGYNEIRRWETATGHSVLRAA